MAGLVGGVKDFVVEDGEVQCKAKANGVCWCEVGLSNIGSSLIGLKRFVCGGLALVAESELGQVTVVVTLPAVVTLAS